MRHLIRTGLLLVLTLLGTAVMAAPLLNTGDRLVFLGDSITEQRIYTRYVMNYFALRYPDVAISFRNAGWGGDYAPGGLARLSRDVLSIKPTVVSICYGMNDGGYRAFDQGYYDRSMTGMAGLVSELQKAGVKVVLLTPGCVDIDQNPKLNGDDWNYNDTLDRWGAGIKALADKEHLPFYNLHALMLEVQTKAKQETPGYTMIPDSVHPQAAGHAIMAYALLKALGCDAPAAGLTIDVVKTHVTPDRCTIDGLKVGDTEISFTRTDQSLPTWFDPAVSQVSKFFPLIDDLNRYPFKVLGLKAGNWKLTVEGIEVGTFSHTALAAGINLAAFSGPWQAIGAKVNDDSTRDEVYYFTAWRNIRLADLPPEAAPEQNALIDKLGILLDAREEARRHEAAGHAWKWVLTATP